MESLEDRIKKFLSIGSGYGYGDGDGDGSGYGDGDGSGYGSGYGYGDGDGYGISSFNGRKVYTIDGTPTLIDSIRGNIAKGAVLRDDLILQPCYVVKENNLFAHGDTLHDAMQSLQEKLMLTLPTEERIRSFLAEHNTTDKYPARDLFEWHHHLTGSCRFGRENFCHNKGIDVDHDQFTVREFIDLTINAYGADVIRALKKEVERL